VPTTETAFGATTSTAPDAGDVEAREFACAESGMLTRRAAIAASARAFICRRRSPRLWTIFSLLYNTPMPTYQYACSACNHEFELVQSFSDEPVTACPECGGEVRKVYANVGVVFKGTGFYKTDSRTAPKSE
jgi:putative FmdB family regulatory protein